MIWLDTLLLKYKEIQEESSKISHVFKVSKGFGSGKYECNESLLYIL